MNKNTDARVERLHHEFNQVNDYLEQKEATGYDVFDSLTIRYLKGKREGLLKALHIFAPEIAIQYMSDY